MQFPELADGSLYYPSGRAMLAAQLACQDRLAQANALPPTALNRQAAYAALFAAAGPGCCVAGALAANWGGAHVRLGEGVTIGLGVMLVDDGPITIGDRTVLSARVTVATGAHPVWPALRAAGYVHNQAVRIGANCVLGVGATVLPGVTIGDEAWVAPGSVVDRDVPAGSRVGGMPARELEKEEDFTMNMEQLSNGDLYLPNDAALMQEQQHWQDMQAQYNQTLPSEQAKRTAMLQEMFGQIGEGCYIEAPMHANWGGHHCTFGKAVYANYGLTMVDDGPITVGDNTMFGPNVVLATAGHPIEPSLRAQGYQYNLPIVIGQNCWFGAGVIVLPGVTIGDNVVVGAGAVVTHDLPSNVVAVGSPAKVLREVNAHDHDFYYKDRRIDWAQIEEDAK